MLKFTGDISLTDGYFDMGFGVGSKLAQGFDPFCHLNRNENDCWIGNFEGVASDVSNKSGVKANQFRVHPDVLKHLHHFDAYGVANNHAMQHGDEAYRQTFEVLNEMGSRCFGSNECKSIVLEHQGRQVSLTAFSQRIDAFSERPLYWHNPECKDIEGELANLPAETFKVAFVHWGNEFINRPSAQQKLFAHFLIDAGFDLVIGMHSHVLQGYEDYHGKRIYYSLGNFVFDMAWEPCKYGAIVSVDLSYGQPVYKEQYLKIGEDCVPCIVDGKDVPQAWQFTVLNEALKKEDNSEEYHNEIKAKYKIYRKVNHKRIVFDLIKHPACASAIIMDFIKRRFLGNVSSDNK